MSDPDGTPASPDSQSEFEATQLAPQRGATQLVEILDRYLADLREGKQPDREQLVADHPEFATQLQECIDGIEFIHKTSHTPDETPAQLDDFRILREVGRGGMGVVYEAEQISLKRRVALKVLRFGGVTDRDAVERFQREAETVAGLDFAHIVPVYAVGSAEGVHYYAMQFIEGRSLADLSSRHGTDTADDSTEDAGDIVEFTPPQIAEWGLQAARALSYAHRHGVIHRDVKPSNLILDREGKLWLTDFGLARRDIDVTLSVAGALLGTPRYMSPEQAAASKQPIDHRTDIYSLGATLYELATGKPVFDADTPQGVITKILNAEPPPPRKLDPDLPRDLETIILKSLAKEPADRYATAADLADDLQAFLDDRPIRARRPSPIERGARYLRRHRKLVSAAGLSAAIAVLLIVGGWMTARSYQLGRLGKVSFTTTGTNLTGEILDENGKTIVPAFSIPTAEPLQMSAGDYQVRLWSDGVLSDTWPLEIDRGGERSHEVHSRSRWLWPPKELNPSAYRQIDTVQRTAEGGEDLLITSYERRERSFLTIETRIRCIDGRSGESAWPQDLILNLENAPSGRDANAWATLLSNPGPLSDDLERLARPLADLNGDGVRDLVFLSRSQMSLLAVSGSDGSVLWWSRNWPQLPDGADERAGHWSVNSYAGVLGRPAVADVDGDGTPDLTACFLSGGATFTPDNGSRIRTERDCWMAAISGRTGEPLWRYSLPENPKWGSHAESFLNSALSSSDTARQVYMGCRLQIARVEERRIVVGIFQQQVIGVDLASGKPAWDPYPLDSFSYLALAPICRDLDGDGQEELLVFQDPQQTERVSVEAYELGDQLSGGPLWATSFRPSERRHERRRQGDWFFADDLNGDGRVEILVATGQFDPFDERGRQIDDRWCGVEAVDAATGKTLWQRKLTRTGILQPPAVERLIAGPDLNGDGYAEVFAAWIAPLSEQPWDYEYGLRVEALSGKDGGTLWRWNNDTGRNRYSPDPSGPLAWWQAGPDGWPLLVVPLAKARGGQHITYFLSASTGRLEDTLSDTYEPRVADVDGDGVRDLIYEVSPQGAPRLLVWAGVPPESWKRLGAWFPVSDLDGDGTRDLVNKTGTTAASGADRRILWNVRPSEPFGAATDLKLAPPMPFGDLDGDGTADLIKLHSVSASSVNSRGYQTIACYSGKTGHLIWQGEDFGMGNNHSSGGTRVVYYNYPAVDWTDLDGDSIAELIVVHHRPEELRLGLSENCMCSVIDGRTGRLRWQTPIVRGGFAAWPDPYGREFPDLNGDGVGDPAIWGPDETGQFELRAIDGSNGAILWSAYRNDSEYAALWQRFAVGDLDGDAHAEVVATFHRYDRDQGKHDCSLKVLDGRNGEEKWSYEWRSDYESITPPLLVDFRGDGTHSVCLGLNENGQSRIQIIGPDGTPQAGIPLNSRRVYGRDVFLWYAADIDGDGAQELLFEDDDKLVASGGSADDILWSWPLPDDDSMLLFDSFEDRPGEFALWSGSAVYGINGSSGEVLWSCEGEYQPNLNASDPPGVELLRDRDSSGPPRVVFLAPTYLDSWATVVRRASVLTEEGRMVAVSAKPREYDILEEAPSPLRALPWIDNSREPSLWQHFEYLAVPSGLAGLGVLIIPFWLIRHTLKTGSWWSGLLLAAYAAFFTLGPLPQAASNVVALTLPVWLFARAIRTRRWQDVSQGLVFLVLLAAPLFCLHLFSQNFTAQVMRRSHRWGAWWWLDEMVLETLAIGILSAIGLIFWMSLGNLLREGRGKQALRLLAFSAVFAVLLAAAVLFGAIPLGRIGHYSWNGWYIIWFWSTFLISAAAVIVFGFHRVLSLVRRRKVRSPETAAA